MEDLEGFGKNEIMKKHFLIWLSIVAVIGASFMLIGENKGTMDSKLFLPLVISIGLGLVYFIIWIVIGSKK